MALLPLIDLFNHNLPVKPNKEDFINFGLEFVAFNNT